MVSGKLRRDAGQLMWVGFPGERVDRGLARRLRQGEAGGAILFARNLSATHRGHDLAAIASLVAEIKGLTPADEAPPLVCVDQEGGRVQRIREPAVTWPPMLHFDDLPRARATSLAEEIGNAIGSELAALGFDVDFAPVLDVHTNDENPVIGDRAFSREPERAADVALAFAQGLRQAGMLACGKHFPGHGDTQLDSHFALPRVEGDRTRLDAIELLPFRRASSADIPMIMTAHVVFSALDPERPATLSERIITGLLREELGYRGVVVSDDLDMKAIADHAGAGESALASIAAGCDVLLACQSEAVQHAAYEAIVREAETSPAFRERIAEAAARVRALKTSRASIRPSPVPEPDRARHRELAAELSGARPATR